MYQWTKKTNNTEQHWKKNIGVKNFSRATFDADYEYEDLFDSVPYFSHNFRLNTKKRQNLLFSNLYYSLTARYIFLVEVM